MLKINEYQELMQNKALLVSQMNNLDAERENLETMKEAKDALHEQLVLRLELYTNFLSDAIAEYEAAHPPEED